MRARTTTWTSKRRNLHPWPVFVSGGSKEHRACLGIGVHEQHILASTGGLGGQVGGDGGLADPAFGGGYG